MRNSHIMIMEMNEVVYQHLNFSPDPDKVRATSEILCDALTDDNWSRWVPLVRASVNLSLAFDYQMDDSHPGKLTNRDLSLFEVYRRDFIKSHQKDFDTINLAWRCPGWFAENAKLLYGIPKSCVNYHRKPESQLYSCGVMIGFELAGCFPLRFGVLHTVAGTWRSLINLAIRGNPLVCAQTFVVSDGHPHLRSWANRVEIERRDGSSFVSTLFGVFFVSDLHEITPQSAASRFVRIPQVVYSRLPDRPVCADVGHGIMCRHYATRSEAAMALGDALRILHHDRVAEKLKAR
jgi:hypothetical protein